MEGIREPSKIYRNRRRIGAVLVAGAVLTGTACSSDAAPKPSAIASHSHTSDPTPSSSAPAFCYPEKAKDRIYAGHAVDKGQKFGEQILIQITPPNTNDQSILVGFRSPGKGPYDYSKPVPMEADLPFKVAAGGGKNAVQFVIQAIANQGSTGCVPEDLKVTFLDPVPMHNPLAAASLPADAILPTWPPQQKQR